MHSVKAAPIDTANGEFLQPGVSTGVHESCADGIVVAVQRASRAFAWRGAIGISVTRKAWRALGGSSRAAVLDAALPSARGAVAVMIHSEAAAHAEVSYGAGIGRLGRVVVATVGSGLGCVLYESGRRAARDLQHLTWTFAGELERLAARDGWCPADLHPPMPLPLPQPQASPAAAPPDASDARWEAWVALLDGYLAKARTP